MTNLVVRFLSAVSAGVVASAPIAMIPLSTVGAAEECLTTPKDETPPGKHWYYRIERGTKRHCWYLREEGETSSQAATSTPARRAAPEVAPDRETKLARSAADAHAELPLPQTLVEADLKISPTTPATSVDPRGAEQKLSNNASPETAQSPLASRWPEPTGVFSSATERPISPSFVVASAAPDANLDASTHTDLTPKVPPVAPTKVETSAMGTPASLGMLLLGTFGAIAVLWLTGSAIYRMARMRRRPQRYTSLNPPERPTEEPTNHTGIPPWQEPMIVNSTRRLDPGRDASGQSLDRQRSGLGDNAREIEQLLARFANQAQAEP
ncbi:hypothetical protein SAMN05444159_2083 [Bradyrhizobium lablabi]|uniref:Uncharacterized protein n=1 Tax=Bradyrhizobium lablabi TaxID=722472 RepID=A0A1M6NRE9_9BRAD|nr:hypothetical protein [Bradyrhizobium lablabi]SHJ98152.1 hypothetical protein SAMN05444159_2083 [Bradyrhizobium lablabi]